MEEHQNIDPHDLGHIVPFKWYCIVLGALVVLTALTVGIAGYDFGNWNLVMAMLVSSVKATLVALVFMHLRYEEPVTWAFAIVPILLLLVLLGGVFLDNPDYRIMR